MRALLAVLVLACTMGFAQALDEGDRSSVRSVIERQLEAFRRDDAAEAYSYAAPEIRQMFPSPERFMGMVREGYRPVYKPRSHAFDDLRETPDGITQSVRIQDAEGVDWVAVYTLERQPDGSWKISGCHLLKAPGEAV